MPPLVEILTQSVQDGEGLEAGVRRARESGGYTLAEIARCVGLSEGIVTRMAVRHRAERGKADLTPRTRESRPDPEGDGTET